MTTERISYPIAEAAAVVGQSESTLRRAINAGLLPIRYTSEHGVILRDDLIAWVKNAPTEKATA